MSLTRLSVGEASAHMLSGIGALGEETIDLRDSLGRVLARDVKRVFPADSQRGRAAGFTDYVAKFDREGLLQSLASCMSEFRQAS